MTEQNKTKVPAELIPAGDYPVVSTDAVMDKQKGKTQEEVNEQIEQVIGDKDYDTSAFSGLGRKNLRKNVVGGVNVLTQEMMSAANTIYVIQYDYDLNGQTITLPAGCVLKFDGGSLKNGSIVGNSTSVEGNYLFNNISFSQSFIFEIIDSSKFIGYENDTALLRTLINLWLNNDVKTLYLENRTYNIIWDKTFDTCATLFTEVEGAKCKMLDGNGAILNDTYDGYVTNSVKNGCFVRFYKCSDISILNLNYVGLERDLSTLNTNDYSDGITLFQFLETTNVKILATIKNQRCFASFGTFYRKTWPELNGCQNIDINIKAENVGYGFISYTCNTLKAFVETNVQHRAFYCGGVTNADIDIVVKSLSTRNIPFFLLTDGQRYLGEEYESETSDGFARKGCSNIRAKIDFTPNTPENFTSGILKQTNLFYLQFYDYDIVQYERTQPLCFENIEVNASIHNGNSNSLVYPRFLEADSLTKYISGDAIKNVKYSLFYDDNFGTKNLQTVVATNLLSVQDVEIKVNKINNVFGGSNQKDAFVLKGGTITTLDMQGYYTVDAESIDAVVSGLTTQGYQYLDKNNNTINPYLHLINTEASVIGQSFTNANGKVENIYSSYRMDRLDNVKTVEPFSFKPVVTSNGLYTIGFIFVAKWQDSVVQVLLTPYALGSKTESPYYGTSFAFPGGSWLPSDVKILTRSYDGTSWTKWFVLARSANASTTERRMNDSQAAKGTIMYNISKAINTLTMFNGSSWTELDGAGVGVARSGTTRPAASDIYVGFQFFDTSVGINKPIYASAISGDTVTWVDATGTPV